MAGRRKISKFGAGAEMANEWTHGLVSCGNWPYLLCAVNAGLCALAAARHRADGTSCCAAMFVPPCLNRRAIREAYGIDGSCCADTAAITFSPVFSIAQAYGETRIRGAGKQIHDHKALISVEPKREPKKKHNKKKSRRCKA